MHRARLTGKYRLALLGLVLGARTAGADIVYDSEQQVWHLTSGPVEYRLAQKDDSVVLEYFGPTGLPSWKESHRPPAKIGPADDPLPTQSAGDLVRFDVDGQVDRQALSPTDLKLTAQKILHPTADRAELVLTFEHRHLPLQVEVRYATMGDTGVLTRQVTLINRGPHVLPMESTPSLSWLLPADDYSFSYLYGVVAGGEERQLATEKLGVGQRAFISRTGRSSATYSPWFCLHDDASGVSYAAQLAYSGNWQMTFEHYNKRRRVPLLKQDVLVEMGLRFDFDRPAPLQSGASFKLPLVAFTASKGDLDTITNQLHRYQREYVLAQTPANNPLITQLNSWRLGRSQNVEQVKKYIDLAAELGLEAVGTDAAWVVKQDGLTLYGDWRADPKDFPHGLGEVVDYAHAKGLKFCAWLEPESVSIKSPIAQQHHEWILKDNGSPIQGTKNRVQIDFRRPDVQAWARGVVDQLVQKDHVDWLKLDYNTDIGERFDEPVDGYTGTVLYDHLRCYYAWLDSIRKAYPNLILENCSSGGLRMDLAMLARTNFTWISDVVTPRASVQLAYGVTIEFVPEACFHWVSGDDQLGHFNAGDAPGWWDFIFRVPMNGPYSIGSLALDWNPALKERAKANVALYKSLRGAIAGADVYHLTPPPETGDDPTGWMALEYMHPDAKLGALFVYRLGQSEAQRTFHLRGLNPEFTYRLTKDGQKLGQFSGRELTEKGLPVRFDAEWRSALFGIAAVPPAQTEKSTP